jgi:hypothetical protein
MINNAVWLYLKLRIMMVRQVLIFKSSVKTNEKKNFLMQILKVNIPEVQSATLDLDDEDSIFRIETEGCSIDRLTSLLQIHDIKVDFLDRFIDENRRTDTA